MAKIMLVEDDKSLREIYGVRLLAEGYEIISAGNGEEALAMAVKEHPNLILSDVMMPKISGFDMLDILRATPETKEIKVIMMTALSSEDQRERGESLGADKYLVKSQVGIEDVVRSVHEILGDMPVVQKPAAEKFNPAINSAATETVPQTVPQQTPDIKINQPTTKQDTIPVPVSVPTQITTPPPPEPQPPINDAKSNIQFATPTIGPEESKTQSPETNLGNKIVTENTTPTELPQPTAPFSSPPPSSLGDRIINPISSPEPESNMSEKMEQELNDNPVTDKTPTNTLNQ